jgi:hypothetical protein
MSNGYRNGAFALGLITGGGLALNLILLLDYSAKRQANTYTDGHNNQESSQIGTYWDGFIGSFVSPSDTLAQWVMAIFTIAATIVLVFTLRSANKTNRAAIAAAKAGNAANKIMLNEQRPWLDLRDPTVTISVDRLGAMCEIYARVMNVGKSPATAVHVHVSLPSIHVPMGQIHAAFGRFVDESVKKDPTIIIREHWSVLPSDWPCPTVFPGREERVYSGARPLENQPFILGRLYIDLCVTYRGIGDGDTFHVAMRGEIPEEQVVAGNIVPLKTVIPWYSIG